MFTKKKALSLQTELINNMAQVLIKYDARNSIAKKTLEFFLSLGIFEVEEKTKEKKSTYNPKFVEKIKQSEESGKWKAIKTVDLWK